MIVEAKSDNLITLEAFEEMRQFEDLLYSITEFTDTKLDPLNNLHRTGKGKLFSFNDICYKFELVTDKGIIKRCYNSEMPLDFVYEKRSNKYILDHYASD